MQDKKCLVVGSSCPDMLAVFSIGLIEAVLQSCGMIGIPVDDGGTLCRSSASCMFPCVAFCFQI